MILPKIELCDLIPVSRRKLLLLGFVKLLRESSTGKTTTDNHDMDRISGGRKMVRDSHEMLPQGRGCWQCGTTPK